MIFSALIGSHISVIHEKAETTIFASYLENSPPKNVFEKHTMTQASDASEPILDYERNEDDETVDIQSSLKQCWLVNLSPTEITDYVNSLKSLAEYWYYSYFPSDSILSTRKKSGWTS